MRSSSARLNAGIISVCVLFALAAALLAGVGVAGVRTATTTGESIVSKKLAQAAQASDVGRQISIAFSTNQTLMLTTDPTDHAQLSTALHEQMIPGAQDALANLRQAHSADSPADLAAIDALITRWDTLRAMLDAPLLDSTGAVNPVPSAQINAAYRQLTGQLDTVVNREEGLTASAVIQSEATSRDLQRTIVIAAAIVLLGSAVVAWVGVSRVRRAIRPAQEQADFADNLQLAQDEKEAHNLLQRHLERTVPGGLVTVLNRNNSADRLEAVTAVPPDSPLVRTLQHAEPQSCLAVRSGRGHEENQRRPTLLSCPVCSTCPGRSSCLPLTVGGEVIGSVLVNRPAGVEHLQRQRIQDSVGQAAPVLANLRNLAIAELRAATDSLTGLPNKRAVGDTLKRMLAQASRSWTPMALLMLDLDHFKDINDRFGHPVGDQALAGVGAALRSALRDSDFAGRNGGEEFTVILPETDTAGAIMTAEKIRAAIAEIAIPGVDVRVTASVGLAVYPDHGVGTEQLERLADSALYVAKRSGRNRIEVAAAADPFDADAAHTSAGTPDRTLMPAASEQA